ncbi:lipopolysaccharide biosynthesis protein RfbH [Sporanaerobium hydrogeniformans]|uniref:lipopolysaccharide biosynthesis protein RfbH n=1 Tax=Sporanaerobium hydrogeniformans TaxID=3072179 RepID=UPI0015D4EDC9|nr:lipopolysaccharide biosynthesis protein RfbH [Sporanaerobium hydrogeniformans]
MKNSEQIKQEIMKLVEEYYRQEHLKHDEYLQGDRVPYAARVYDERELENLIDASLEFWLTSGRYTKEFEIGLAKFLDVKYCYSCNSGSSANLLAFMALTSPLLGERRINRGDEVITVAAGFPTTISPIIQYGAVPVFVDITIPEYNIDCSQLELARTEKTKAVMIAHTLGNPFNLEKIRQFCNRYNLWLVEDNCDALGSKYYIDNEWKYTGTIGDIGTSSFYPPHHITMGEGGAVYTNNSILAKILLSLRDWGRDCCCPSGVDNLCSSRFSKQYGELPVGYDHKYVYGHLGYNLKITDMQAAIGCAQLEKLPNFIKARKENWEYLRRKLEHMNTVFTLPEMDENTEPSWFGFVIGVKANTHFNRNDIVKYLESKKIQTRMLFAGNIIKHPCFDTIRDTKQYRQVGDLHNTEYVMNNVFWIGVYPGMTRSMLDYMVRCIEQYVQRSMGE